MIRDNSILEERRRRKREREREQEQTRNLSYILYIHINPSKIKKFRIEKEQTKI